MDWNRGELAAALLRRFGWTHHNDVHVHVPAAAVVSIVWIGPGYGRRLARHDRSVCLAGLKARDNIKVIIKIDPLEDIMRI